MLIGAPNWFLPSAACLSDDGATLAFGANDRVHLVDSATAAHRATLRSESQTADRVACVVLSRRRADLLLTGTLAGRVGLWHLRADRARLVLSLSVVVAKADAPPQQLVAADCGVDAFAAAVDRGSLLLWPASLDDADLTESAKSSLAALWRYRRLTLLAERLAPNELLSVIACSTAERGVVAVGTTAGRVFLVDCRGDGTVRSTLQLHDGRVESVQFQPLLHARDRLLFASGGADGKVVVCAQSVAAADACAAVVARLAPDAKAVEPTKAGAPRNWHAVAWLPSESGVLVSGGAQGELYCWRLAERRCELLPSPHRLAVFGILFGGAVVDDGCSPVRMVTHSLDRITACWDARDWSVTTSTSGLSGHCVALAISASNGSQLIAAVGDGALRLWDVGAARREELYQRRLARTERPATLDAALDVLLTPRGEMCRVAVLYRGFERATLTAMECHPQWRGLVAVGRADGIVVLYNVDDEEVVATFAARHTSGVRELSWRRVVAPSDETSLRAEDYRLYSLSDAALLEHDLAQPRAAKSDILPRLKKLNGLAIHCAQWSSDGACVALGHDAGVVSVVLESDEVGCVPMQHTASSGMDTSAIRCVRWRAGDADESAMWLAAGGARGQVRVYRADLGRRQLQLLAVLGAHKDAVRCLAWRPQRPALLLSGAEDGTAQVLDIDAAIGEQAELLGAVERGDADFDARAAQVADERRAHVANFRGHSGRVLSAAWSLTDADLAFTGGSDLTLRMWRPSEQTNRSAAGVRKTKRGK